MNIVQYFFLFSLCSILVVLMSKQGANSSEGTSEPFNCKICVLRVSIHCEGCKRKVIKILHTIHGVHAVEIDRKQHKIAVTTNLHEQTLIKKLKKAGKHAEPWPETKPISTNIKEKQIAIEIPAGETSTAVNDGGNQKRGAETETPAKEVQVPPKNEEKCGINGNGHVLEISKGGGGGRAAAEVGAAAAERAVESSPEGSGALGGPSGPVAVEAGSGGGGEVRRKKKSGQRKVKSSGGAIAGDVVSPLTVPAPPSIVSSTTPLDQFPSSNHNLPLNQPYYYPIHTVSSQQAYVASYNTVHPSTYGSCYAAPPAYSYAYSHSPPSPPPLPSAEQPNSPSWSPFEYLSDENPSGCSVM